MLFISGADKYLAIFQGATQRCGSRPPPLDAIFYIFSFNIYLVFWHLEECQQSIGQLIFKNVEINRKIYTLIKNLCMHQFI